MLALAARGPWKPKVGDSVFVPRLRSSGTVSSVHDGGRQLGIRLGSGALGAMTTRVSVEEVERVVSVGGSGGSAAEKKKKKGVPWKRL